MGNHGSVPRAGKCRNAIMKAIRIGSPSRKWTMFENTLTIGSTSAGNSTFLIRLPPLMRDDVASVSDDANQVHGSSPQKRNTANGVTRGSLPGMIVMKTNE